MEITQTYRETHENTAKVFSLLLWRRRTTEVTAGGRFIWSQPPANCSLKVHSQISIWWCIHWLLWDMMPSLQALGCDVFTTDQLRCMNWLLSVMMPSLTAVMTMCWMMICLVTDTETCSSLPTPPTQPTSWPTCTKLHITWSPNMGRLGRLSRYMWMV